MLKYFGGACFEKQRCQEAKRHGLLRFELFKKIDKFLSLNLRNILISPLEGEKKFLSELNELRNFKEGFNLKRSCRNSNSDLPKQLRCILLNKFMMLGRKISLFIDTVFSRFTSHFSLKRKTAFTLAEVLITLGIIGIVASLTMPTLIQNYKKQQATARIKKFVSITNQALITAENDLGPREDWVIEGGSAEGNSDASFNFLNTYIKPYIKSAEIEKRQLLNMSMATLRFVDGSQMSVKIGACYDIYYDINGENKPNKLGKDIFVFILCKNKNCNVDSNQLRAFYCETDGSEFPSRESIIWDCKSSSGTWCTLLLEQNSYEFPKDYPLKL